MDSAAHEMSFGKYRLSAARRLRTYDGAPISLGSRAFDILQVLLERSPDVVTKEELARRVWGGYAVDDNTLAVHISALRKALGDGKDGRRFIGTMSGRGYRFLQTVGVPESADRIPDEHELLGNLPSAHGPLIGRDDVLAEVTSAVRSNILVTLTGPGGIGKTRLAMTAGEALVHAFRDGGWVDLSAEAKPEGVADAVGRALGLPTDAGHSASRVVAHCLVQSASPLDDCRASVIASRHRFT